MRMICQAGTCTKETGMSKVSSLFLRKADWSLSLLCYLSGVILGNLLIFLKLQFLFSVSWESNSCFTGLLGKTDEYCEVYIHKALCSGQNKHSFK